MRSLTERPSGEGYLLSSSRASDGSRGMVVSEEGGQVCREVTEFPFRIYTRLVLGSSGTLSRARESCPETARVYAAGRSHKRVYYALTGQIWSSQEPTKYEIRRSRRLWSEPSSVSFDVESRLSLNRTADSEPSHPRDPKVSASQP